VNRSRQRMVYDTLSDELAGPVHALSLLVSPP
jgi:stress-induced morphogen